MANVLTKVFGSRNQRLLRGYGKSVATANEFESEFEGLNDAELRAKTDEFRQRLEAGASVDQILPEAFAAVREASKRTLGERHFDVQLVGGITLHEGKIAEMRTGEGKTLVATLSAYLNALTGDSVHIVTVNEYLAQRDADWMGPIYEFLGLNVGVIKTGQTPDEKRAAYAADITYGTNNEFGFDYLRDNLAFRAQDRAQRDLSFAIVDEVDSILIDEARTPLIISGPSEESTDLYEKINKLVPKLRRQEGVGLSNDEIKPHQVTLVDESGGEPVAMSTNEALTRAQKAGLNLIQLDRDTKTPLCKLAEAADYTVDEKGKQVHLTEEGQERVEQLMHNAGLLEPDTALFDATSISLLHHLNAALRAHSLYHGDVEYIVTNGEVVIVDEFTGRTMPGRRWSDGLHQAVEAKEGVKVKDENQTLASITFQNYFRMYNKLAGMTGTADTEAFEFQQIYGLEVVVIPTHEPMIRIDNADLVYLAAKDKYDAIVEDIEDCRKRGQPLLVGTTSIETSELLSGILKKRDIPHQVLNAKQHEREAVIVEQAGRPGRVTIATNMAGRGTDIVLGGNLEAELKSIPEEETEAQKKAREAWKQRHAEVLEAGGLHMIGTERHESRRIDNQLRGRSGRQGDPGSSRFYLSMEDTLMRIFGDPERTKALLSRVGMKEGEAIESRMLSKQIERAQRKVEAYNFDIRKNLLEYDDVANDQRKVVYSERNELMAVDDIEDYIAETRREVVNSIIDEYIPPGSVEEQWETDGFSKSIEHEFAIKLDISAWLEKDESLHEEPLRERILAAIEEHYEQKVRNVGAPLMRHLEKAVMLRELDSNWKEHLAAMDYLRQGIHLRGYAQKNPKQEYKREAFDMFVDMLDRYKRSTSAILSKIQVQTEDQVERMEERRPAAGMQFRHANVQGLGAAASPAAAPGRPNPATGRPGPLARPEPAQPFVRDKKKVGRNEPCPCGSGKKYKHCHGRLA
ncbi:MAG: preprotein translocase subunit SecA [Gammaproteobacteria bacterium]